ncbi:DMT family transporter [Desertimonas flava]|uniref:DMT family transporter n=1 Tax=Desertimonas flava TaxID=2064846 RepID=UPI000E356B75|nr:DMT family transporter [Desertimonas flava]
MLNYFARSGRAGVVAVVVAFAGLSIGSTIAKSTGEPGPVVAFWRFCLCAVIWHAVVAVRGRRNGSQRTVGATAWRAATIPGLAFGVNLSLFFSGATRTPIAHAEFISALTPVVMVPLAARLARQRVERAVVLLGAVALSGIALILSAAPAGGTSLTGDALVIGAVATWILYLMIAKSARARVDTPRFMAVMSTAAAAVTLPIALVTADSPGAATSLAPRTWVLVTTMAVVSGVVAHGLIAWAQQRVAVGTISLLQLTQPALGVLWAAIFLGEPARPVQLIGMLLVLVAVGVIARRSSRVEQGRRAEHVTSTKSTRNASVTPVT